MSDVQLKWAIKQIETLVSEHGFDDEHEAWQRLKPRLTPDRERVACAISDEILKYEYGRIPERAIDKAADAAIGAMREP